MSQYQAIRSQLLSTTSVTKRELTELRGSKKRLDSEVSSILDEILKGEQKKEDILKRTNELEMKKTELKTKKDSFEKELNNTRRGIEEKQRVINTSHKFGSANRDKELKVSHMSMLECAAN